MVGLGGVEPPGDLVPHLEEMADVLAKVHHLFEVIDHHFLHLQHTYAEDAVWGESSVVDDLSHALIELEGLIPSFTDHQRILLEEVRTSVNNLADDIHGYEGGMALSYFEQNYHALKESFTT